MLLNTKKYIEKHNYMASFLLIFTSILLEVIYDPSHEKLAAILLVITYDVIYLKLCKITSYTNTIIGLVLNIIIFVRLVLMPLLIVVDVDYMDNIVLYTSLPNKTFFIYGIILTLYESIFVGFYLFYNKSKIFNTVSYSRLKVEKLSNNNFYISICVILLLLFTLLDSSVFETRQFVFSLKEDIEGIFQSQDNLGSISKTISTIAFRNVFLLFPIPFASWAFVGYLKTKNNIFYWLLLCSLLLGYGLFLEGTSRASILIPLFSSFLVLRVCFPQKIKSTTIIFISFFSIVLIIITIWKFYTRIGLEEESGGIDSFVTTLEIYFMGIGNMGRALYSKIEFGFMIRPYYLFNDFFHSIPVLSHLTDSNYTSSYEFLKTFDGRQDQVIPAIGNGLFSLGFFLSPLIVLFQMRIASWFERQAYSSKTFSKFVIFTYCTVMLIYGCYSSLSIFVQKLTISISVASLITYYYDKRFYK